VFFSFPLPYYIAGINLYLISPQSYLSGQPPFWVWIFAGTGICLFVLSAIIGFKKE
jgi:FtsH-binding integral membrane protein